MKYKVETKQGKNYIVSDESVMLWVQLERDLKLTFSEAIEAAANGSLNVLTYIIWRAAKAAGHTDTMTQDGFIDYELEMFEPVVDDDPKAPGEVSAANS